MGDPRGRAAIARIAALAISPAWRDVWICPYPMGHLQAIGVDAAGRKQYRYHDQARPPRPAEVRLDGRLRRRAPGDAPTRQARPGWRRAHARARTGLRQRLLDLGSCRIGSEEYAERNDSYGLATMLKRHVRVESEEIVRSCSIYEAKTGQRRVQAIADPTVGDVIRTVRRCRGGGPELLAHRNGCRWINVRSEEINEYLKAVTARDFSAKDFRTWNAIVLAAVALAAGGTEAETKTVRKRAITSSIKAVSAYLGNTPAVCRASYIDPLVFDRYHPGWTVGAAIDQAGGDADLSKRARTRAHRGGRAGPD